MVPCGHRADKPNLLPAEQRLEMCQKAIEDFFPANFPVKIDDIEVKNGEQIKTYFLLQQLAEIHGPKYKFYFLIGSDLVPTLHMWHPRMIIDTSFVIYNRMGYEHVFDGSPKDYDLPHDYQLIDVGRNLIGMISSTLIR